MPSRFVTMSCGAFALSWVTLLLVHTVTVSFFSFFAYFYWSIPAQKYNYLATCLDSNHIGMKPDTFQTIAILYGLVALLHGLVILRMLTASLYYRSFAFLIEPRDLKNAIYRLLGLKRNMESPSAELTTKARSTADRSPVVIPCVIIVTYVNDFDMTLYEFPMALWYEDIWFMHAFHEFQILFVTSWRDLATRMVFSIGMLVAISDIKNLLGDRHLAEDSVATTAPTVSEILSASPRTDSSRAVSMRLASMQNRLRTASRMLKNPINQRRITHFVHISVIVWGTVVLGLHLHAESIPVLSQCPLQVRPWGETQPACSLVLLNCYKSSINGTREDVDVQWNQLHSQMVSRILVRHCPALEMPPVLQKFSQLRTIKIYNSSIHEWKSDAAITRTFHPNLLSLFIARANMTDGKLPDGLISPEFPPTLKDIEFSTTNLRTLPDDLDTKWPTWGTLYFEYSAFTSIPDVVMRLLPETLSFCGNPIENIPTELFAVESIFFLHIGDNANLKALPANATMSSSMGQLYISNTQVALFSSWVDTFVNSALSQGIRAFMASGTPYCERMSPVFNHSLSDVDAMEAVRAAGNPSMVADSKKSSTLMDTSASNRGVIYRAVTCEPGLGWAFFPLATEDAQSAHR
uniref:Uncharacterized protein n=1 Tax=Globisporangium ultimum (strain ATCC 200006 / CBS 805.95 / DAOM BR144) TaxID=431595 RepID=K3WCU7_GLOUD